MRTLNNETTAALPARLSLARKAYAQYFARTSRQEWALFCSTFVPYEQRNLFAFLRSGAPHWLEVKEHIENGCLCPSQVVDVRAGLIATFTSLNARGERSLPVLKVQREPLCLFPERLHREGARLASACIFHASSESWRNGYWSDFSPLPVDALVRDDRACGAAFDRLSPLAWKALDIAVGQLDGRFEIGLRRVDVPHEIVWNAF